MPAALSLSLAPPPPLTPPAGCTLPSRPQVDRDTLDMLKAINMGNLPGITVAAAATNQGNQGGGFKGGFRK